MKSLLTSRRLGSVFFSFLLCWVFSLSDLGILFTIRVYVL
jgi:hypothetical protein